MATPTRSPLRRGLRRLFKLLAIGVVLAVVAGAIYEAWGRRHAARNHPAPGRLVDIGGRRMHLDCRGQGSPVVLFESGLDLNGSLSWATVHDSIARSTRACAYDRAGIMWSDRSPGPRNGTAVAADLHAALSAAGETGPFVLVGHSLGGPYIMTYTKAHPDLVAGLVFVDASHPDQIARFAEATGQQMDPPLGPFRIAAALRWIGVPRLLGSSARNAKLPDAVNDAVTAYVAGSLGPMLDEAAALPETFAEAGTFRTLDARPVVVLTAAAPRDSATLKTMKLTAEQAVALDRVWHALHAEEASWSSAGRQELVPDAGHYVQLDRPDVVIRAVREVVARVRGGPAASDSSAQNDHANHH